MLPLPARGQIAEVCAEYSVDVYRYFLLRAVSFGADGDFSRETLRARYNADLANGVGNLLSRTVQMIGKYFDGAVPAPGEPGDAERGVRAAAEALAAEATGSMEACAFHAYLDRVLALADETNRYIDATEPFKLAKDPAWRDRLGTILYTCAEAVRLILLYLRPVLPAAAVAGLGQLGWAPPEEPLSALGRWGVLAPGTPVRKGPPLFPRKP